MDRAEIVAAGGARGGASQRWRDRRDVRRGWRGDRPVLDLPGLRCLAASPEVPLSLKVLAHRTGEDEEDLRLLAGALSLDSAEEILAVAERTYGDRFDPAARFFVEALFGD